MQNNEFKNKIKVLIKYRTFYYFDDIIKFKNFDFDDILIDEKLYEIFLICDILYKTLIGAKPLHIRFDKIDGFIGFYNGTRYLVLFDPKKCDTIYNRVRYLTSQKVVLHMLFLIILQELKLIHMIHCLQKKQ